MHQLTELEQQILPIIQTDFPLVARPYQIIGATIGATEDEIITILHSLKRRQFVRQISAIFNTKALGFTSTLLSVQVPPTALDDTAAIISSHPGVSHNYERKHRFNLWFTLTLPEELDLPGHITALIRMTHCLAWLHLPAIRTFKRRVQFDVSPASSALSSHPQAYTVATPVSRKMTVSPQTQQCVMEALHHDLPLSPTPFADIARRCEIDLNTLFGLMQAWQRNGTMHRFAGIVKHRQLGFRANAMVVWQVPPETVTAFGEHAAQYPQISHCYVRATSAEWPYNLYTMIHGKTHDATQAVMAELSATFGLHDYEALYSGREFKKQRVDYFSPAIAEWDRVYVQSPAQPSGG